MTDVLFQLRRAVWRVMWFLVAASASLFAQAIAPTIHTVSIDDGDNLHPGTNLTLHFTATDGSAPLQSATFNYATSDGYSRNITTDAPAGRVVVLPVTDDWPNGEYRLQSVWLQSALGTSYFVPPANGPTLPPPGSLAAPGPSDTLFLTRFVVSGAKAHVPPQLTAIVRTGNAENAPGGSVTFQASLTPGSSAIRQVILGFNDPYGNTMTAASSSGGDPSQISLALPDYLLNGKYTLQYVAIDDASDQGAVYYRTGQLTAIPGPVVHKVPFTGVDFTVSGGASSYTFPALLGYTLRTTTAKVGDTIAVDFTLTPGSRSLKSVIFTFKGPVQTVTAVATAPGASGTATLTVKDTFVSGNYTLDRVDIYDIGGYEIYYQSNGLFGTAPVSLGKTGQHSFQLARSVVNVTGGIAPIPVISLQPQDITVDPGKFGTLTLSAGSPAGYSIQWYEGASGDTSRPTTGNSSTFSVQGLTNTTYWARVSNSFGSVDTRAAAVNVRFASAVPTILVQPGSATVPVGNFAGLSATVTGPGPLTVTWFHDGVPIPGATDTRLSVPATQTTALSGSYYFVATNAQGSVRSDTVQVILTEKPQILAQSTSRTVMAGDRVTFDVTATGGGLQYFWGKDGTSFGNTGGSTYTLASVQAADSGTYTVGVSNNQGSASSSPMVLTVVDPTPPMLLRPAADLYTAVGLSFGTDVYATGNTPASYALTGTVPPGLTWNASQGLLNGSPTQAGDYVLNFSASNRGGTVTQKTTIHVAAQPFAPLILTQPKSQTVYVDQHVVIPVSWVSPASFFDNTRYQWQRDGVPVSGYQGFYAGNGSFELAAARPGDAGVYTLTVYGNFGTTVSQPATLTVLPALPPPTITTQPQSVRVAPGGTAIFTVAATSSAPLTYQWSRNGTPIDGATNATLTLTAVEAPQGGTYTVDVLGPITVTGPVTKVTSAPATLTLDEVVPGHLTNLSVRSFTASGDRTLIAGFAVAGTQPKPLLLRVTGPTLAQFGVTGTLPDPKMTLVRDGTTVDSNDNWMSSTDQSTVTAMAARVGAFALPSFSTADSAMERSLTAGTYSVVAGSGGPGSGVVLIELYDADQTFGRITSRLVNLSARSQVSTDSDVLIAGFFVSGETPCRLLIRGVGPGLAAFGVGGVLAAPHLQIYNGQKLVGENIDWRGQAADIAAASASVGAFALGAANADTAILVSLPAGAYTAVLSGVNNTTGVGLLEIYQAP